METIIFVALSIVLSRVPEGADQGMLVNLTQQLVASAARGKIDTVRDRVIHGELVFGNPCTDDVSQIRIFKVSNARFADRVIAVARDIHRQMNEGIDTSVFGEFDGFPPYFKPFDVRVGDPFCRWAIVFRRVGGAWKLRAIMADAPVSPDAKTKSEPAEQTPPATAPREKAAPREHQRKPAPTKEPDQGPHQVVLFNFFELRNTRFCHSRPPLCHSRLPAGRQAKAGIQI